MWLELRTAPTIQPLTLAEVKTYLRVDYDSEDGLISLLIASAVNALDGWSDGKLGRALITQQWRAHLDGFPSISTTQAAMRRADRLAGDGIVFHDGLELGIVLPLPPLISVEAVKYLDIDGVEQTLSASVYTVEIRGKTFGRIRLNNGEAWPSWRSESGCVRIDFTCGYGATAADVPASIRQAMMMAVADAYDNRGMGGKDVAMAAYDNLLAPFRVPRF
jgi:hypothetical protein